MVIKKCFPSWYFNPDRKTVDVEHLGSLEVLKVSALKLEKLLVKFFEDNNIPWSNLVSMLMGSCGFMRGSKMGLETSAAKPLPNPS